MSEARTYEPTVTPVSYTHLVAYPGHAAAGVVGILVAPRAVIGILHLLAVGIGHDAGQVGILIDICLLYTSASGLPFAVLESS